MTDTSEHHAGTLNAEAGLTVRLFTKLGASLETLGSHVQGMTRAQERTNRLAEQAAALLPIRHRARAVDTAPASGQLTLLLGGPSQGRQWDVRRIVVGPQLPSSTAAGVIAYVYVTAADKSSVPVNLALDDWADTARVVPAVSFYGVGEVPVLFPEKLFVVFTGGTQDALYMAAASVLDSIITPTSRADINT